MIEIRRWRGYHCRHDSQPAAASPPYPSTFCGPNAAPRAPSVVSTSWACAGNSWGSRFPFPSSTPAPTGNRSMSADLPGSPGHRSDGRSPLPRAQFSLRFLLVLVGAICLVDVLLAAGCPVVTGVCRDCGALRIENRFAVWSPLPDIARVRTRGKRVTRFLEIRYGVSCSAHSWTRIPPPRVADCKPGLTGIRWGDGSPARRFVLAFEGRAGEILEGMALRRPDAVRAFLALGLSDYYYEAQSAADALERLERTNRSEAETLLVARRFDDLVALSGRLLGTPSSAGSASSYPSWPKNPGATAAISPNGR